MGGSKSTTTTNVPPPTAQELEKQSLDLELAKKQLAAITAQETLQAQIQPLLMEDAGYVATRAQPDPGLAAAIGHDIAKLHQYQTRIRATHKPGDPALIAAVQVSDRQIAEQTARQQAAAAGVTGYAKSPEASAREQAAQATHDRFNTLQTQLLEAEVARIQQGTRATPEQKALIASQAESALASYGSDVTRFSKELTEVLTQEFSQAAGLRPSDTPIQDRGAKIAEEGVRLQGQFGQQVRGAQAAAELNFPLEASRVQSAATTGQQELLLRTQDFQNSLRQQAFSNRFAASGFQGGLGIAGAASQSAPFSVFNKGTSTTQKTSGNILSNYIIPAVGAAGAAFTGGASLMAAAGYSASRNL